MPIAINGSGTLTGVSVGGLPDGIVDTDMLANNAVTAAKATGVGFTPEADGHRLTSDFSSSADPITSNWERNDSAWEGTGYLGASLITQSSGIFTFAATGYYLVMGKLNGNLSGAGQYYFYVESTDNNSSYSDAIDSNTGVQSSGRNFVTQVSTVLKVEDTSNDKVRFTVYYEDNGGQVNGNGNRLRTSAQFIKIADI